MYCDTSVLVTLYIEEHDSDVVRTQIDQAEAVATGRIAWAEFHAAVARRAREIPTDTQNMEAAKRALADDWPSCVKVTVDQTIVEKAGDLADAFALRVTTRCTWRVRIA